MKYGPDMPDERDPAKVALDLIVRNERRWRRVGIAALVGAITGTAATGVLWATGRLGNPTPLGGLQMLLGGAFLVAFLVAILFHFLGRSRESRRLDRALVDRSNLDLAVLPVAGLLGDGDGASVDERLERAPEAMRTLRVEIERANLAGATPVEIEVFIRRELEKQEGFADTDARLLDPVLDCLEQVRAMGDPVEARTN